MTTPPSTPVFFPALRPSPLPPDCFSSPLPWCSLAIGARRSGEPRADGDRPKDVREERDSPGVQPARWQARPGRDVGGGGSVASAFGDNLDDLDEGDYPEPDALSRQHSGGSVSLGESEVPTEDAALLRERLELPALVASVVIDVRKQDFILCGSRVTKTSSR